MSDIQGKPLRPWAYGDWDAGATEHTCAERDEQACAGALDVELLAESLGVRYTTADIHDPDSLIRRLLNFQNELAKSMAEDRFKLKEDVIDEKDAHLKTRASELGCPYTDHDLRHVHSFTQQLDGIERANKLAVRMGVGPIDFAVRTQSVQEYLEEEDRASAWDEREKQLFLEFLASFKDKRE